MNEMSAESENVTTHNGENKSNSDQNENSSNGLENFSLNEEETPELFNSENEILSEDTISSSENDSNSEEEDDLEIPAFLRRQKN